MRSKRLCAITLAVSMCLGLFPFQNLQVKAQEQEEAVAWDANDAAGREKLNFNQGWKFKREYREEAIQPDYSLDELKNWENVNLPHTVRLEKYMNSGVGETYQGDAMYVKHFPVDEKYRGKKLYLKFEGVMGVTDVWVNGTHMNTALASETGDNTMYGGYLPFVIDISNVIDYGEDSDNVITVYTTNQDDGNVPPGKPASQLDFTYFGGIYRDVYMEICEPVHITDANYENIEAGGGILVDYPEVSEEKAIVDVNTHIRNESSENQNVTINTQIIDADDNVVAEGTESSSVNAGEDTTFEQELTVEEPKLWNLDTPYMHTLVSTVLVDNKEVDKVETPIGIRKIEMGRDFGLKINGEVQDALIGTNRHQEYAYIGYAGPNSLQRRDAVKLKENGVDVVRTGHYPQDPEFLDACDELGILVIEPTPGWQWWQNNETFKTRVLNDIRQMVRRDRNRPCILAYETVLNESTSVPGSFTQEMAKVAKSEHPSAKTATENSLNGMGSSAKDEVSDIMYKEAERGTNAVAFQREYGDSYREQYSQSALYYRRVSRADIGFYPGGEGAMFMQAVKRLMGNQSDTAYYCPVDAQNSSSGGGKGSERSFLNMAEWADRTRQEDNDEPVFIGSTSWVGFDHNRSYEDNMSECGLWDLYRIPKFAYYAMQSQRDVDVNKYLEQMGVDSGPMLFTSSYWTENAPVLDKSNELTLQQLGTDDSRIIVVYSNAEKVRLKVMEENGTELWEQEADPMTGNNREMLNHAPFQFEDVPYTTNTYLLAEGLDENGNVIAKQEVHTAGEAKKLELEADTEGIGITADGSDMMMVYAYVKDADGTVCHDASNELKFSIVQGDAKIVGDNNERVGANPVNAIGGIIGVYIQAGTNADEDIVVRVESEGLEAAEITIDPQPMTEKAAPYKEIEYTGSGEEISGYLTTKEQLEDWDGAADVSMQIETIEIDGKSYRNSIGVMNNQCLRYDLEGKCKSLTGSVYVDPSDSGKEGIFRVYVDGVEKWKSNVLKAGETESFNVDVSGGSELVLVAEDQNTDVNFDNSLVWLSPYVNEGKRTADESELRENLALDKPVTASSSVGNTSPSEAVDGNESTIWRGEEVHSGEEANPQEWIVDLGANYNVRNARVGLEHDSIGYTYEIYTSPDGSEWTYQCETTKTSQASDVIDEFTAQDVRYVKVRFTSVGEHAEREQYSNATISEFEIYRDLGIASTDEYNLKGLSIENHDLVFDPATKEYTIGLEGYESELRVKALPFDTAASVSINGQPVSIPQDAAVMADVDAVVLTDLGETGQIVVNVTSVSGVETTYTVNVDGQLGKIYNSNPAALETVKDDGTANWYYGERNSDGTIQYLAGEQMFAKNGDFYLLGSESWARSGSTYMHPGNNVDAVRTYEAAKDGDVVISLNAQKYATNTGKVGISVLKNGEKVWPQDSENMQLSGTEDVVSGRFQLKVAKGDKIHFVVEAVDGNASDATNLNTMVCYAADLDAARTSVSGAGHIRIENNQDSTEQYQLDMLSGTGTRLTGLDAVWSIEGAAEGISIDAETGILTVKADAAEQEITVKAVSEWNPALTAEKTVRITKHTYETSEIYVSDLEWNEEESEPTEWGVVGKDKVLSYSGDDNTKLSLTDDAGQKVEYEKGLGVNSYSKLVYDVKDAGYTKFESWIGIDHMKYDNPEASVTFEVWKDDMKVFESANMGGKTPKQFVSADITGAEKVTLIVTHGSDGKNGNDNADWADAKFISVKDTTTYSISGNVDPGNTEFVDISGIEVNLYAADDTDFESPLGSGTTEKDGDFIIDTEVLAGNYILQIKPESGKYKAAEAEVTVVDDDVSDVQIELQPEKTESSALKALKAILGLKNHVDFTGVDEDTVNIFEEACKEGEALVDSAEEDTESVSEEELEAAWEKIFDSFQKLKIIPDGRSVLEQLVTTADHICLDHYILKGQYDLKQQIAAGKQLLWNTDATEDVIDAATAELQTAINNLEKHPNKNALNELLAQAAGIDRTLYTQESLAKLDEEYAVAQRIANDLLAGQDEVNEAADALNQAIENLVYEDQTVSKKTLEYFLNRAKEHVANGDVENCVESVQKLFEEAIAEGETVMADESATRDEVMNASMKLIQAIHALNMKAADKTDLEMAVELGDMIDLSKYVEAGQQEFKDALEAAKEVLADGDAMQGDVDDAWDALVTAMENLRLKANKDVLEDLLNEAAEVDLSQYTEESAEAFRAAYAAAQEVFADETLTEADQQKVDDAVVALKEAKAGLAALAGGSGDGNQSGDTDDGSGASGSENTDKSNGTSGSGDSANRVAKTGDTVPVMGLMMLVIVSGAAAVAAYRKRVK